MIDLGIDERRFCLAEACWTAHAAVALRGNASHMALRLSAQASGDYCKAIIAALTTVGIRHAPMEQTYALLTNPDTSNAVETMLKEGQKIAGWGNSFVRGEPDPAWAECARLIGEHNPALAEKIASITELLHSKGKNIFPNPSCYTAAIVICMSLPAQACYHLFIQGRLHAWTQEYFAVLKSQDKL